MKISIGTTLKKARKNTRMSIENVCLFLSENNIHVAAKTIYGWENDFSSPNISTFLLLCKLYGIMDILKTFGYESLHQNKTLCFHEKDYSKEELEDILKYAEFIKFKRKK